MASIGKDSTFGFSSEGLEQVGFSFLVSDALKLIVASVDKQMTSIGLSKLQWATIVQVFRLNNPSQSELARAAGVGRAAMGVAIDELESLGYVSRKPDTNDRRVWRIAPTAKAWKRSIDIAQATERATSKIYSDIDIQELRSASEIFRKIIKNLN